MAQTLGSMTVCIKLANSTVSNDYIKKYEEAAKRSFKAHHTIANRVGKALIDAPVSAAPQLIGKLADLSLLVPPRNQRRMFFPLHSLPFFCLTSEEIKELHTKAINGASGSSEMMDIDDGATSGKKQRVEFTIAEGSDPKSGNAYDFDCSGKGALKCWIQYTDNLEPKMVGLEEEKGNVAI